MNNQLSTAYLCPTLISVDKKDFLFNRSTFLPLQRCIFFSFFQNSISRTCNRRQPAGGGTVVEAGLGTGAGEEQLGALFDPEVGTHGFPVLATHHVQQPILNSIKRWRSPGP